MTPQTTQRSGPRGTLSGSSWAQADGQVARVASRAARLLRNREGVTADLAGAARERQELPGSSAALDLQDAQRHEYRVGNR
jgi:hypothetical protein